jgi:hypothetical protein
VERNENQRTERQVSTQGRRYNVADARSEECVKKECHKDTFFDNDWLLQGQNNAEVGRTPYAEVKVKVLSPKRPSLKKKRESPKHRAAVLVCACDRASTTTHNNPSSSLIFLLIDILRSDDNGLAPSLFFPCSRRPCVLTASSSPLTLCPRQCSLSSSLHRRQRRRRRRP